MNWPLFRSRESFRELQMVRLLGQYTAPEGVLTPGSQGTIVYRHRAGAAFEVEFARPFATVVTLRPDEIAPIDG